MNGAKGMDGKLSNVANEMGVESTLLRQNLFAKSDIRRLENCSVRSCPTSLYSNIITMAMECLWMQMWCNECFGVFWVWRCTWCVMIDRHRAADIPFGRDQNWINFVMHASVACKLKSIEIVCVCVSENDVRVRRIEPNIYFYYTLLANSIIKCYSLIHIKLNYGCFCYYVTHS